MGRHHMDSAKGSAEADRVAIAAEQNLNQVILSLKNSLQVVRKTRRMLEVDPECPECICMKSNDGESKWEMRNELDVAAKCIEKVIRNAHNLIGAGIAISKTPFFRQKHAPIVIDDNLRWCDRICVYEKVDMDRAVWCTTPQTILELVFARLPLNLMFRMRCLSKHWRGAIVSPSFQLAFRTTTSRRFAIVDGPVGGSSRKRLLSFGTRERKWYMLPFDSLPSQCDNPVVENGGLLCCQHQDPSNCTKDRTLYMCNPLTQAWRKLPLPLQVQEFDLVHLVTNKQTKQYTITVISDDSDDLQHHTGSAKAIMEVYDSGRKTWSVNNGVFQLGGDNLFYYKKYVKGKFVGIRAYDKTTGYSTSIPCNHLDLDDIILSEGVGFSPLMEHQGQIYMLRTDAATSGVWVLRPPSHVWEKLYSLLKTEDLKYYFFSLIVSADAIIIYGEKRIFHVKDLPIQFYQHSEEWKDPRHFWILDRVQETWIDVTGKGKIRYLRSPQIMFEMRLDAVP